MSADLNIEQAKQHPTFAALTARQQAAAIVFLETGDKAKAVQTAYKCGALSVRPMAWKVFRSAAMVNFLIAVGVNPSQSKSDVAIQVPSPLPAAVSDPDAPREKFDGCIFPVEALARVKAMPQADRAQWEADRFKAETDPLFLADVIGFDLQFDPHYILFKNLLTFKGRNFPLHQLDSKHRVLLNWSRGTAKTFCIRVLMTQAVLNYPDIRIVFLTGGDSLAVGQSKAFKRIFEHPTERFKYLFPEMCFTSIYDKRSKCFRDTQTKNKTWGDEHQFNVPARGDSVLVEPTFMVSTEKSNKTGLHCDFMFGDDLVHQNNWRSADLLNKCYENYQETLPLIDPNQGFVVLTGTRYSYRDTYGRIQDDAKKHGGLDRWKISVRGCYSSGHCTTCGHSEIFHSTLNDGLLVAVAPNFYGCLAPNCECKSFQCDNIRGCLFPLSVKHDGKPIGQTPEFLQQQLEEMGVESFTHQYLNAIVADTEIIFTPELIAEQTIDSGLPPWMVDTFLVGDLGYSTTEGRDETVLFAFRKFAGRLYFFDCQGGRWDAATKEERIIRFIAAHRPKAIYLEKNQGWEDLEHRLNAHAHRFGLAQFPLVWLQPSNQKHAKLNRIESLQPTLKSKMVWLYRPGLGIFYDRLVEQLTQFPHSGSGHDDYADALSLGVSAPTGVYFDQMAQPLQADPMSWLRRLNAVPVEDDSYPDSGGGSGLACG